MPAQRVIPPHPADPDGTHDSQYYRQEEVDLALAQERQAMLVALSEQRGDIEDAIVGHIEERGNPHEVTKEQVGLDEVDNTSDADKPISDATGGVLQNLGNAINTVANVLGDKADTEHEHSAGDITDGQFPNARLGTSSVNTRVLGNNSVTETQLHGDVVDVIAGKADADHTHAWEDVQDKPTTYPPTAHTHTPGQVGLGNVDNTADADKPVSDATQSALNAKANASSLAAHTGNTDNPHSVTASQLGLGAVDNTSDADKPISDAQDVRFTSIEADIAAIDAIGGIPPGGDAGQVLGKVTSADHDISWINQSGEGGGGFPGYGGDGESIFVARADHQHRDGTYPSSVVIGPGTTVTSDNSLAAGTGATVTGWHGVAVGYQAQATALQSVALGDNARAEGVKSFAMGEFAWAVGERSIAIGANAWAPDDHLTELRANQFRVFRSEGTGASELGLYDAAGNVHWMDGDDIAALGDAVTWDDVTGKPEQYPPQSHTHDWDEIEDTPSTFPPESHSHSWGQVTGKPTTYPPSGHTHTPGQVGLGNVDNTADSAKPVSSATQTALDGKADTSHNHGAANITSGTLAVARIPNLPASRITSGTLAIARLPTGMTGATVALGNHTHTMPTSVAFLIDGDGEEVSTGVAGTAIEIPFAATITGWSVTSAESGSIACRIRRATYAAYPTFTNLLTNVSLTSAQKRQQSGLSVAVTAGWHLQLDVTSVSGITACTVNLRLEREVS